MALGRPYHVYCHGAVNCGVCGCTDVEFGQMSSPSETDVNMLVSSSSQERVEAQKEDPFADPIDPHDGFRACGGVAVQLLGPSSVCSREPHGGFSKKQTAGGSSHSWMMLGLS